MTSVLRLWRMHKQNSGFGECFKHALVVNTQAFRSVEFFQHALVANAQAKLQFEECFRHMHKQEPV